MPESKQRRFETEVDNIRSQLREIGTENFLKDVHRAARKARTNMPKQKDIKKMRGRSKLFVERVSGLISEALEANSWSEEEAIHFVREVAWANVAAAAASRVPTLDNEGGEAEPPTCVTKCSIEYDKCMEDHNCGFDFSWYCVCCIPCSLQYAGCVAKCSLPEFEGGGINW